MHCNPHGRIRVKLSFVRRAVKAINTDSTMGLDAYVRCRCIQDGLATPHPFSEKLTLDDNAEPGIIGNSSSEESALHDRWFADSCEHGGYLLSERLGNIEMVSHIRTCPPS